MEQFNTKLALILFVVSACLFGLIHAEFDEDKVKRQFEEDCPQDVSCDDYAKKQVVEKLQNYCVGYELKDNVIVWTGCSWHPCPNGLKRAAEDLSKPYPECCAKCQ